MMAAAWLPFLWYPLFTSAAVAGFALMVTSGAPLPVATFAPIVALGVVIVLLEWRFPERLDWRPRWSDIAADGLFMLFVQVVLPRLLVGLAVIMLAGLTHAANPSALWPQQWPLAAQAIAMVLIVDFVRYWLHRACHQWDALWRLHEVHHSPDILYVLNVGRFHPVEKSLHFCADTLPFLVLGVAPEVIACYFLLYSVNGLFQHSNVRLRYGWLNYVVGSAETHRWHHARDPRTAMCNFSNTTIIWDLVFRTWRLPGAVGEIGITDRDYPKDFWSQLWAPLSRRARRSLRERFADLLVGCLLRGTLWVQARRIGSAARDPMRAQRALLKRILKDNAATTFGREHGFAGISDHAQFARLVPVSDFEALRPYVEAEIERGEAALSAEAPMRYVRTSGTTGKPKDVPLTRTHLTLLRRAQRAAVAFQYRACPEAFAGSIVAIVSPGDEGVLANGKPFGASSGIVAGDTPLAVRAKFIVPPEVLAISDSRLKYLAILRLASARRDLSYLGSANSTTLLALAELYREHRARLIDDLRTGTFFLEHALPRQALAAMRPRLGADPRRARELDTLGSDGSRPRLAEIWPNLRLVVAWTCGSAGVSVAALRRELADTTRILELGYLASEFRATITIGRRAGSGLPTWDTHFFEFVERDLWDRNEPRFLTLDQLRKGIDYYVIVTTPSGLYRYFINDLVTVTGHLHRMPLMKFAQKGKGVTNITGEKLYETQVLAAVNGVVTAFGFEPRFVMMLADEVARRYRLFYETDGQAPPAAELSAAVDARLRALNVEYEAKRESGRLAPLAVLQLARGTGEAFKRDCVARGQREGQFKTVALAYRREVPFDFEAHACGG